MTIPHMTTRRNWATCLRYFFPPLKKICWHVAWNCSEHCLPLTPSQVNVFMKICGLKTEVCAFHVYFIFKWPWLKLTLNLLYTIISHFVMYVGLGVHPKGTVFTKLLGGKLCKCLPVWQHAALLWWWVAITRQKKVKCVTGTNVLNQFI